MSAVIDVHHHWIPPDLAQHLGGDPPDRSGRVSSIDRLIADLDRYGIAKAVINVSNHIESLDLGLCRQLNDAMYRLKQRFPDRILTLAHVPIGEPGAVEELERTLSLGVSGVFSIVHLPRLGWSLDHPGLDSFYERVSALGLPIVTHPATEPLEYVSSTPRERLPLLDHNLMSNCGRPYNTTVSLMRLLLSKVLDRFPGLRFLYPHLGGTFGVMKERMLSRYYDLGMREDLERRLRQVYFDMAPPRWSRAQLRCAVETIGADRIMFGTDHAIEPHYLEHALNLARSDAFTDIEREGLFHANAKELFGARI